ncbi:hypothetical protein EON67_01225 [archaeon]|nr:MAG: hypothetical protein EON67_01225 [archaeon]
MLLLRLLLLFVFAGRTSVCSWKYDVLDEMGVGIALHFRIIRLFVRCARVCVRAPHVLRASARAAAAAAPT